jgi:hypothetical protein
MRYNTPELTALSLAINAIQKGGSSKMTNTYEDSVQTDPFEASSAYADWE